VFLQSFTQVAKTVIDLLDIDVEPSGDLLVGTLFLLQQKDLSVLIVQRLREAVELPLQILLPMIKQRILLDAQGEVVVGEIVERIDLPA
jgi:hypothetical protein